VSADPTIPALLDEGRVRAWLDGRLDTALDDLTIRRVSAGHSNEMFELRAGPRRWILRRPPRATADPRASNMAREHRILTALDGTGLPHPRPVAFCDDVDVTGVPFLVMEWVDGFPGHPPLPGPFRHEPSARREMALALVDSLVTVADTDWRAVGLVGFGRPEGFLERQVDRWLDQLARYRRRAIPLIDDVAAWLTANRPTAGRVGLIHGDYGPGNVLFAPDRPGRIAAVVDWEQSTIGDPRLDVGWLLALWSQCGDEPLGDAEPTRLSHLTGVPSRQELRERYEERSGRRLEHLAYFEVLALFKLACVLEGSYQRHCAGLSDDPHHVTFETRVPALIRRAHQITVGNWI
jgi:aminoglycoside phosphotransferase (APT) family kinase protein